MFISRAKEARCETSPHAPSSPSLLPLRFSLTRRQFTVSLSKFNLRDCQSDLAIRFDADNRGKNVAKRSRLGGGGERRDVVDYRLDSRRFLPPPCRGKRIAFRIAQEQASLTSVTRHGDNNESVLIGSRERLRGRGEKNVKTFASLRLSTYVRTYEWSRMERGRGRRRREEGKERERDVAGGY